MREPLFTTPHTVAEPPTTFTVRPLTEAEIAAVGGSIGLLLPAVQKGGLPTPDPEWKYLPFRR
jgi:hypothetical protein